MHIEIHDHTTLGEIQEVFERYYPYLRLAFFKTPHKKYESSDPATRLSPDLRVGDVRRTHISGLMEIQPGYRVADLERAFQLRMGLPVQVFRQDRDQWVQTLGTDDFTLKDLNEISHNASDEYILSQLGDAE